MNLGGTMNLDEAHKQKVAGWIKEGLKLSEIQNKLASEFGIQLTYMEVRFLVDDLKLTPKDQQALPPEKKVLPPTEKTPEASAGLPSPDAGGASHGGVSVMLDSVTRPGAVVSGRVTFSDGAVAQWYLDQFGRLGLAPQQQGYKPSAADLEAFQIELQNELQKAGL
jgi:hypothetical protein